MQDFFFLKQSYLYLKTYILLINLMFPWEHELSPRGQRLNFIKLAVRTGPGV